MSEFQGNMPGGYDAEQQKKMEQQKEEREQMKNMMLSQILDQEARARLNNLKISKPEKAEKVEGMIINLAQRGQIGGKMSDSEFVRLLESINDQMTRSTSGLKVNYDRRRNALDSDDEDYS